MNNTIPEENKMEEISITQLVAWKKENTPFLLLDVREEYERKQGHLGGLHIPLGELLDKLETLPSSATIVVYCGHGMRSLLALPLVRSHFPESSVVSLRGGFAAAKGFFSPE